MYPVSIAAVLLRLGIHRLLRHRMLHSGEVLALGLFEGAVLYHALNESAAVGAGCFLGFGGRLLLEHLKQPDPMNVCCSLLGLALGILLSNVLQQLWSDSGTIFYDDDSGDVSETITRRHRTVRIHHRRNRSSRTHMHIPGAPDPDPPAVQRHRRTKHNVPDQPFTSQWEGLQAPIDRRIGLENEVLELRRRASAAAGEVRRLREEKKWAIAQGNKAREFQLSLDLKNFQELNEQLNRKAAERIAIARGQSLLAKGGDIELGGMTPAEAIDMTDKRLKKARANGDNFVRVSLAGTNLRVTAHGEEEQEVRPLLETFLRGRHHSVVQDPSNGNYLIVSVDSYRSPSTTSAPQSDEWSRALD